jgi:DNA gyrase inhibitor GyrI
MSSNPEGERCAQLSLVRGGGKAGKLMDSHDERITIICHDPTPSHPHHCRAAECHSCTWT